MILNLNSNEKLILSIFFVKKALDFTKAHIYKNYMKNTTFQIMNLNDCYLEF
jgi:hypothetical protein